MGIRGIFTPKPVITDREALPDALLEKYDKVTRESRIGKTEDLDSLDNLVRI